MKIKTNNFGKLDTLVRVLITWRRTGHIGLTYHALVALLGNITVDQLRSNKYAYIQWCGLVKAPVWSVAWSLGYSYELKYVTDTLIVGSKVVNQSKSQHSYLCNLEDLLIKAYPPSDGYIGVSHCKGIKTWDRISYKNRLMLLKVASGKLNPFRKE